MNLPYQQTRPITGGCNYNFIIYSGRVEIERSLTEKRGKETMGKVKRDKGEKDRDQE